MRSTFRLARVVPLIAWLLSGACRQVAPLPDSALHDLTSLAQFRDAFNADVGRPRLVVIVSPTCGECLAGARWAQDDVLAKYPDRDLKVFVIWLAMLRTDARSEWPRNEIVDPRAQHFWDPGKTVGATLAARDDLKDWRPVAWDIWAMYPADTTWREEAPRPAAFGRTIIKTRNQLGATIAALPVRQAR